MKGPALIGALVVAGAGATPGVAHVDVLPTRVADGEAREFVIRVPTERDVPTTAVTVRFPSQVTVFSLREPPSGWRVRPERSPDGRIIAATWRGGRIDVDRFQTFAVLGTPFGTGTTVWETDQTYADGLVKRWTGEPDPSGTASAETSPDDPGPAAAVEIVPASEVTVVGGGGDDGSGAAIWLGVIAIGIAALAALGTGLLWSSRPRQLPPDG